MALAEAKEDRRANTGINSINVGTKTEVAQLFERTLEACAKMKTYSY